MNSLLRKNTQSYPISNATALNWKRLKTNPYTRLAKRANKRNSVKQVIPLEYFSNLQNKESVIALLDYISKKNISIKTAIFSLAKNHLERAGILNKEAVQSVLHSFSEEEADKMLLQFTLPTDEYDFLGLIYQCLLLEGKKNSIGSYYTPLKVIQNMTGQFDFSHNETFLDPCCGSGAFLLSLSVKNPLQLFGTDNDPIATFIAKVNLLIKFKDFDFMPQIICVDYLSNDLYAENAYQQLKFDYIATNPPWGAASDNVSLSANLSAITSKETFSYFFIKGFGQLKTGGTIRFLFPEAILNVKLHKDIRAFMFTHGIQSITRYKENFSGVVTHYVDIAVKKDSESTSVAYQIGADKKNISLSVFLENDDYVFNALDNADVNIIKKIKQQGVYFLNNSVWALGIVTGDNKGKLFETPAPDLEKIYTGKEILPFVLKDAKNFIRYDRCQLQQVAKDEIYRAKEKLVYKFISNKLTFAYDDTQSLFLNSANILIPNIPCMSIKTVMAFLNSEIFQYLYIKLFGEIKILKGNLMRLPFPNITASEDGRIVSYVDLYLKEQDETILLALQNEIYHILHITDDEIQHIRSVVYGKID